MISRWYRDGNVVHREDCPRCAGWRWDIDGNSEHELAQAMASMPWLYRCAECSAPLDEPDENGYRPRINTLDELRMFGGGAKWHTTDNHVTRSLF